MQNLETQIVSSEISPHIHWGHFGTIVSVVVLLVGMTWVSKPEFFQIKHQAVAIDQDSPHYYPYVAASDDLPKPEVLGASTNQGPSMINEDGSVVPVNMGEVLGASTQDVQLSLDSIKVNSVQDSAASIQKYFVDSKAVESSPIDNIEFETALSSGNQNLISQQAAKLAAILSALQKVTVPAGLVKLQKLKIIQYETAIAVLQNFTQADKDPELVGGNLQQFLKSQQELSDETAFVTQKYNLDPLLAGGILSSNALQGASQGAADAAATINPGAKSAGN